MFLESITSQKQTNALLLQNKLWSKQKTSLLPAILAYESSKVPMAICIMDSLCHFLLVEYGQ